MASTLQHEEYRTRHSQARKIVNVVMLTLTGLMTLLAIIPLLWIVTYVMYQGWQYISVNMFTQTPRPLGMEGGGVRHAIEGTMIITLIGSLFAVPTGVVAAFYAARSPNTPLGIGLRFSTDVLAGVPSIVIGLFAYAVVVKPMGNYSALAGGIAMAILMLPTIIRTTEEMLKLVPNSLHNAAMALGAPEWKTWVSIIFPAALSGIVTGFLLAIARAAGETAPLLFTALGNENYSIGRIVRNGVEHKQGILTIISQLINQPADSLPLTIWKYAQQPYPERIEQAWAVAFVLMLFVLLTNILTRLWMEIRRKQLQR